MSDEPLRSPRRRPPLRSTESVMLRIPPPGSKRIEASSSERRVLVVDDHDDTRTALVAHFRAQGWEVDVARDVKSAIESALAFQPHLIVSELLLPDARGYFFARTLRSIIDHDIRLVGLTRLSHHVFEEARVAGFDVVFAKPIDVHELARHLELP